MKGAVRQQTDSGGLECLAEVIEFYSEGCGKPWRICGSRVCLEKRMPEEGVITESLSMFGESWTKSITPASSSTPMLAPAPP